MQTNYFILFPIVFGVIGADYVGPQNGFRNGNGNENGNGNGNAYGVPTGSITPPQPQGGPYPPSGWKPAGRRLLLPGESRGAQQPIDSGYGQPPPSQYGPVNPSTSGPSVDNQYGPSVDNTGPSNQYIPGTGFGNGNGFSNGNGHGNGNGNGHNGSGNGFGNGNGHNGNGNGHNGNGNGHNGNGNGHNGNGNGNGHSGNGNGQNGNGNGNGNGLNGNGNGHNGNGHTGNGNGFSNGNGKGNGNGNGSGNGNGNGASGFAPAFHGAFPGGVVYPFVQHSVPAVLAFRPSNGAGHGSIYPLYQVPITPSQSGTGIIASSLPAGHGGFSLAGANPTFQISHGASDFGAYYPGFQITGVNDVAGSHPVVVGQDSGLVGHGIGQYYTLLSNHQSQKSNLLGLRNGLINQQLQYALGNGAYGSGVPLGVF